MDKNKIIRVEIVEKPLWQKVLSKPFRYYRRAAGFTFCLVSLSNVATTLCDPENIFNG